MKTEKWQLSGSSFLTRFISDKTDLKAEPPRIILYKVIILRVPSSVSMNKIHASLSNFGNFDHHKSNKISDDLSHHILKTTNFTASLDITDSPGQICVGFDSFSIKPYRLIYRCTNCQLLGHRNIHCRNNKHCENCSASHDKCECRSPYSCCLNCARNNGMNRTFYNTDHPSSSRKCPSYLAIRDKPFDHQFRPKITSGYLCHSPDNKITFSSTQHSNKSQCTLIKRPDNSTSSMLSPDPPVKHQQILRKFLLKENCQMSSNSQDKLVLDDISPTQRSQLNSSNQVNVPCLSPVDGIFRDHNNACDVSPEFPEVNDFSTSTDFNIFSTPLLELPALPSSHSSLASLQQDDQYPSPSSNNMPFSLKYSQIIPDCTSTINNNSNAPDLTALTSTADYFDRSICFPQDPYLLKDISTTTLYLDRIKHFQSTMPMLSPFLRSGTSTPSTVRSDNLGYFSYPVDYDYTSEPDLRLPYIKEYQRSYHYNKDYIKETSNH